VQPRGGHAGKFGYGSVARVWRIESRSSSEIVWSGITRPEFVMLRVAVLASADSWYARDLARAAAGKYELIVVPFSEMQASLQGGKLCVTSAGIDLMSCDAVLVRTMPPGSLEQVVFR